MNPKIPMHVSIRILALNYLRERVLYVSMVDGVTLNGMSYTYAYIAICL